MGGSDRDSVFPGNQIQDRTICQQELDITNTPTDGQFLQINMPTGNFTTVNLENVDKIATMETNIALNAFRIAINGSLNQFNMVDGIVDEYEDESGIDTVASTNEAYDSVNDLYSPTGSGGLIQPFSHMALENNTDAGSGANTVSDIGTPTYTSGKLNNALTLNGSDQALNLDALQTDIASDTTGSISVWFNLDNLDTTAVIVAFGDTNGNVKIRIRVETDGTLRIGTNDWNHQSNVSASTWHHLVVVQDGVSPLIYLNGTNITNLVGTIDTTTWFSDYPGIDNGRLGCINFNSGGDTNFWGGQIDDFRYYQNKALTQTEIDLLYNSGTGTEEGEILGTRDNMTLISNSFTAEAQADNARIDIFEEDVDSITLNTDLKAYASRDGGTTFTQITLVNQGEYESGRNIISASVDISSQPAGTSMIYKLETLNNKDLKIHGSSLNWD